jgi:hypothetical protein
VNGADIIIPLNEIHSVGGSIVQGVNNQPVSHAKIHPLYADDREEAMSTDIFSDGTFLLPFVPQGSYILQVTDATVDVPATAAAPAGPAVSAAPKTRALAPREMPIAVDQDVSNLQIALVEPPAPDAPR